MRILRYPYVTIFFFASKWWKPILSLRRWFLGSKSMITTLQSTTWGLKRAFQNRVYHIGVGIVILLAPFCAGAIKTNAIGHQGNGFTLKIFSDSFAASHVGLKRVLPNWDRNVYSKLVQKSYDYFNTTRLSHPYVIQGRVPAQP